MMKHFTIYDFEVDSHINQKMAATAARNLDRVLGGTELGEDRFRLTPGSIPDFCGWELGSRWGHCHENGRITEWNGTHHVIL